MLMSLFEDHQVFCQISSLRIGVTRFFVFRIMAFLDEIDLMNHVEPKSLLMGVFNIVYDLCINIMLIFNQSRRFEFDILVRYHAIHAVYLSSEVIPQSYGERD